MSITSSAILHLSGITNRITKRVTISPQSKASITLGESVSNPPSEMEIKQAIATLQRHSDAVNDQLRLAVITCPSCQNEQMVKDSIHVTDHWYERPYGCTEGDNWLTSYGKDKFICNECSTMHTLPPEWNTDGKQEHSKGRLFARRLNSYDGKLE